MRRSSTENKPIDPSHVFTMEDIEEKMSNIVDDTLEGVDSKHIFDSPKNNKGIAGHIIEESVLGYKKDNRRQHDIEIDGVGTEVKTTGLVMKDGRMVAKEPITITAVKMDGIVLEEFDRSHFWDKARCMLLVYYLHDYKGTFNIQAYRHFVIIGWQIRIIQDDDKAILESDWNIVKEFVIDAKRTPEPEKLYPELSHLELMFTDIAPKYPRDPRFRFKRLYVDSFVQEYLNKAGYAELPQSIRRYDELDAICSRLTSDNYGKSVRELIQEYDILAEKVTKDISERIVLAMFRSEERKLNRIGLFNKLGIQGKTIVQSVNDGKTEDMKLFKIDFDEIRNPDLRFKDSQFYSYFSDYKIMAIVFKEQTSKDVVFADNRFVGFKRISFDEEFIENHVHRLWREIRRLVNGNGLKEIFEYNKDGSVRMTPKTNVPVSAPNFPKSEDHLVFVRGSGADKSKLPLEINGIRMLSQYVWIRGKDMVDAVNGKKKL